MDMFFKSTIAIAGAVTSYLLGGWSALLDVLLLLVVVDYVSGVIASGSEGKLSSKVGLLGIAKKVFIFLIVMVAHKIDIAMGNGSMLKDAAIWFYIANELLSILENAGRFGLPLPPRLLEMVAVLKGKGDKP